MVGFACTAEGDGRIGPRWFAQRVSAECEQGTQVVQKRACEYVCVCDGRRRDILCVTSCLLAGVMHENLHV